MSLFSFFGLVILWVALVALRGLRLELPPLASKPADSRRQIRQEQAAIRLKLREERLADLQAVRYLAEALVVAMTAWLLIGSAGFLGVWLLTAGLLLVPLGSHLRIITSQGQQLYQRCQPWLLDRLDGWHRWLAWLSPAALSRFHRLESKEELIEMARRSSPQALDEQELSLIENGLAFKEKLVGQIMTPRSMIDGVSTDETLGPVVLDRLHKTGHSRFPVMQSGQVDKVVGMLYMRDLLPLKPAENHRKAAAAMRPEVYYIREDQNLEHALYAFLRTQHHLFIVVNRYRETVGLLSLEDVIESLLGRKIIDEFDAFHDLRAVAESNPRSINQPRRKEDV